MNIPRALPALDASEPTSTAESIGQVRGWLEYMTSTNPYLGIDWSAYQTVLGWCSRDDYRPLVEEVLKRRLATAPGPSAYKAILLAQALPPASLVPHIDALKKLAEPAKDAPASHLNIIAKSLLEAAQKHKADTEKKKTESDWDAWCGLYGKPLGDHAFPPPPTNPEWGMWGLVPVPADEWWKAPDKA